MDDVDSYNSYKAMRDEMTPEEMAAYRKSRDARNNLLYINQMYEWIEVDEDIIELTKAWLHESVERFHMNEIDESKLKEDLLLGAELIKGCEDSILITRAEIAHYTKYPLHSEKRRQWYRTKEGMQWQEKVLNQLKKK